MKFFKIESSFYNLTMLKTLVIGKKVICISIENHSFQFEYLEGLDIDFERFLSSDQIFFDFDERIRQNK